MTPGLCSLILRQARFRPVADLRDLIGRLRADVLRAGGDARRPMGLLGRGYRKVGKSSLPRAWRSLEHRHTHVALDDAIEQGTLFANMLKANARRGEASGPV